MIMCNPKGIAVKIMCLYVRVCVCTHVVVVHRCICDRIYENCTFRAAGITRQERWDRAKMNGLEPPEEIETILSQHPDNPEVQDW